MPNSCRSPSLSFFKHALIVKIFLMIVYQPNFLFLSGLKACLLTLFVLLPIQLTRVYQG
ncbi:hypothetical protein PT2222_180195 [Paraburkholderia tropica]